MFFFLSKAFWLVAQPLGLATLLALAAFAATLFRWRRLALAAGGAVVAILFVACFTTLGLTLLVQLEERFPRPALPERLDGIIVLGGAFDGEVSKARGTFELGEAADRFVEAAALARRYPNAAVIVAGGGALLSGTITGDAEIAPRFFSALGIAPGQLVLEDRSVNTWENAVEVAALPQVRPDGVYLLVTSAFHMPRAMGCFRTVGLSPLAWPVDHRTTGRERFSIGREDPIRGMIELNMALREWIGLAAYWWTGRTGALFPTP